MTSQRVGPQRQGKTAPTSTAVSWAWRRPRRPAPAPGAGAASPNRHELSRIRVHPSATGRIQYRLAVGRAGDPCEVEAERVADRVVPGGGNRPPGGGDGPGAAGSEPGGRPVRSRPAPARVGGPAPPIALQAARAPGRPLDPGTRASMEPRLGCDLDRVRVHTDARADAAAAAVGARAFTVGSDIVFRGGEYAPATTRGRHLLAHELTHVVQQSSAPAGETLQRQTPEPEPPRFPDAPGLVNALSDDIGENLFNYGHHFYRVATLYPDRPDLLEQTFGRYALGANVLETGFAFFGADAGTASALALGTGITFKGVNFLATGELVIDYQIDLGRNLALEAGIDLAVNPNDFTDVLSVDAGLSLIGRL